MGKRARTVRQIGRSKEVYDHTANTSVATFLAAGSVVGAVIGMFHGGRRRDRAVAPVVAGETARLPDPVLAPAVVGEPVP